MYICHDIAVYTSLLETQACLDAQLILISHLINVVQDAFKRGTVNPHQILQFLLFLDPAFHASNAQIASLYAGFSWTSSNLLLKDSKDCGYKLCEVPSEDAQKPMPLL
uniref:Uncharacterized protein n=1 Tax=Moniliophthora roreri TaxID=221103 RepID=A0A0W0FKM1_MONRR